MNQEIIIPNYTQERFKPSHEVFLSCMLHSFQLEWKFALCTPLYLLLWPYFDLICPPLAKGIQLGYFCFNVQYWLLYFLSRKQNTSYLLNK